MNAKTSFIAALAAVLLSTVTVGTAIAPASAFTALDRSVSANA